jgi:hypothetical protein
VTTDNPDFLDPHPDETQPAETETPKYVPEPFRLEVGKEYMLFCKTLMTVVYEYKGQFMGMVKTADQNEPLPMWYFADGTARRNLDTDPEQDPFDVKALHRDPDSVFLLRRNGEYTSNNCFRTRDAAIKAALDRGGEIVEFKEIMDQ